MEAIEILRSYSSGEVIAIVFALLLAVKFCYNFVEWGYERLKKWANITTSKDKEESEFRSMVVAMAKKIDDKEAEFTEAVKDIKKYVEELKSEIHILETKEDMTQERLKQDTRSDLIDLYKRFMVAQYIDELSFENFSSRYTYYKETGGNTYIDELMDDIKDLRRHSVAMTKEEVQSIGC